MLIAERQKAEVLAARLAEAMSLLEYARLQGADCVFLERLKDITDSAPVCEACGGTGKAYLLHSRAERPCPMCAADQPDGAA